MFEKGKSGNPAGRKKGTVNKSTEAVKFALAQIAEKNVENADAALKALFDKGDYKNFLSAYTKICTHVLPKNHVVDIDVDPSKPFRWLPEIESPYDTDPDIA